MHVTTPIALLAVVAPATAGSVSEFVKLRRAGESVGTTLAGAPINNITVTPSNVVQCSTASILWTGATEPVDLSIGVGGFYVGTTWLTTLSAISGGSAKWEVDQPTGKNLIFEVKDALGAVGYVQNIDVGPSDDSSCLASASGASSSASAALGKGSSSEDSNGATANAYSPAATSTILTSSAASSRRSPSASSTSRSSLSSSASPTRSVSHSSTGSSSTSTIPSSSSAATSATLAAAASPTKSSAGRRSIAAGSVLSAVVGVNVLALVGGAL